MFNALIVADIGAPVLLGEAQRAKEKPRKRSAAGHTTAKERAVRMQQEKGSSFTEISCHGRIETGMDADADATVRGRALLRSTYTVAGNPCPGGNTEPFLRCATEKSET